MPSVRTNLRLSGALTAGGGEPPADPAEIALSTALLEPTAAYGADATQQTFDIENTGETDLEFEITKVGGAEWLSVSPESGTVAPGDSEEITVTYNTDALPSGEYSETLRVTDAAASNSPQDLEVDLEVTFAISNVSGLAYWDASNAATITTSGDEVTNWASPAGGIGALVPHSSSNRPDYDAANDAVTFNGTSDSMTWPVTASSTTHWFCAVVTPTSPAGNILDIQSGRIVLQESGGRWNYSLGAGNMTAGESISHGTKQIVTFRLGASVGHIYCQGRRVSTNLTSTAKALGGNAKVGSHNNVSQNWGNYKLHWLGRLPLASASLALQDEIHQALGTQFGVTVVTPPRWDAGTVDLVLFAGQSNAVGRGKTTDPDPPSIPEGAGYAWDGFNLKAAADPVLSLGADGGANGGNGPVPSFIETYADLTGHRVVVVQAAIGGSSIAQWQPGQTLHNNALAYLSQAKAILEADGHTVNVVGVCWAQGEADTLTPTAGYQASLQNVVDDWHTDYPGTQFVISLLGIDGSTGDNSNWQTIRNAQEAVIAATDNCIEGWDQAHLHAAPADEGGTVHYTTEGYRLMGTALATALAAVVAP